MSLAAYLMISAGVAGLFAIYGAVDSRMKHWPAFWVAGFMVMLAVPFLSMVLPSVSWSLAALPHEIRGAGALEPFNWGGLEPLGFVPDDADARLSLTPVLTGVYALVAAALLLRLMIGRMRAAQIARLSRNASFNGRNIWISNEAASPFAISSVFLAGPPRIVMPADLTEQLTEAELAVIIRHEQTHIDARDDQVGVLLRTLTALNWINPFAHLMLSRWKMACELRSDSVVVEGADKEMRRAYAAVLLSALHITADRVRPYPVATFSTSRIRNEKMRIRSIMSGTSPVFKRARSLAVLLGSAAAISVTGGLVLAGPAAAVPIAPDPVELIYVQPTASVQMVDGDITSRFGPATDPFNAGKTRQHKGIDIKAPLGTPIYAPASGTVRYAGASYRGNENYGNVVVIETKGGVMTLFAHLDGFDVAEGDNISLGQQIARVGNTGKSTGPHVHIEVRIDGKNVDPETVWDFN